MLCLLSLSRPNSDLHFNFYSSCSTYNYVGCHVNKLISAFEKGDLVQARTIQVLSISQFFFDVLHKFWLLTSFSNFHEQFKMQELLGYANKLGEWRLCHVYQMIYKINKCSCAITVLLCILNCFIVTGRLWSGSEQAADEWGVRLVSGAPPPPCDAMSSCTRSVHHTEISQHFFWIMIRSHWMVEPWKTQHLVFT